MAATRPQRSGRFDRPSRDEQLEAQLADHRQLRAELLHELERMRGRVDGLEREVQDVRAATRAADELERLNAQIAQDERALRSARERIAYLEQRIVELRARDAASTPAAASDRPAAVPAPLDPPASAAATSAPLPAVVRRRRAVAGAAALLGAVVVGVGLGASASDDRAAPARPAAQPKAAAPAPRPASVRVPPSCAAVGDRTGVTCVAGTLLTIAGPGGRLTLPDLAVRVIRAERAGTTVTLGLRLRNRTAAVRTVAGDQLYLSIGGRKLPAGITPALGPRAATAVTATVALDAAAVQALDRSGGVADLGVRPFAATGTLEQPGRLGVVRLRLPG